MDTTESKDIAKANPEIVARLTQLARAWQATLPTTVDPSCISTVDRAPGTITPTAKRSSSK